MNLTDQAKKMRLQLAQTGETQTCDWKPDMKLILRRHEEKMQLVTVGTYRQANRADERPQLIRAFNIPANAAIDYDQQNGYGIVKWTWIEQPPANDIYQTIPPAPGPARQTIDLNQTIPPAARQLSWLALADHLEQQGQRLISVTWPEGETRPVVVVEALR